MGLGDADGQIGKVKRIASPEGVVGLVAAAGEGGAATWSGSTIAPGGTARSPRSPYFVRAVGRTAGNAFAASARAPRPATTCAASPSPPTRTAA